MRRVAVALALPLVAPLLAPSAANADILYRNTFESGPLGPEWSAGSRLENPNSTFTRFNGRYANGSTTLTLAQPNGGVVPGGLLPGPTEPPPGGGAYYLYRLTFDLYTIDSWDGNLSINGPDFFSVHLNNTRVFHESFANVAGSSQTFRGPDVGNGNLGYSYWYDAIYRQIGIDFTMQQPGDAIAFRWSAAGLQDIDDESWGIDNVSITYQVVPAPGLAALVGLAAIRRPRRR